MRTKLNPIVCATKCCPLGTILKKEKFIDSCML